MPHADDTITSVDFLTLAALASSALGDPSNATWTLTQIKEWTLEAVKDYGAHFQRTSSTLITCTAGTRQYSLPTDTWWVHRAEHPTNRTPPAYLERFSHSRSDFTQRDDRYDWTISGDQTTATIWISRTPATGDYIEVLYSGYWWSPSGGSYIVRVREQHYPILINYVLWRAAHERWMHALIENLTITYTPEAGKTAYTYAIDRAARWYEAAELARKTYEDSLNAAKAQIGKSDTVRWEMSDADVVY